MFFYDKRTAIVQSKLEKSNLLLNSVYIPLPRAVLHGCPEKDSCHKYEESDFPRNVKGTRAREKFSAVTVARVANFPAKNCPFREKQEARENGSKKG